MSFRSVLPNTLRVTFCSSRWTGLAEAELPGEDGGVDGSEGWFPPGEGAQA
jgi:hypothetical protein